MDDLWECYNDFCSHDEDEIPVKPPTIINDATPWFNDPAEARDLFFDNPVVIMLPVFYTKIIRETDKMWFVEVAGREIKLSKNRAKIDRETRCIMLPDWLCLKINQ